MKKLEFYWKDGTLELRACPYRLVRFHEDEENVTIDFVKNYKVEGEKTFCYSIGYFRYDERYKVWELHFCGDGFLDVPPEQAAEVFKQLGNAYKALNEWKMFSEDGEERRRKSK